MIAQKGAQAKKSKVEFLKTKADAATLLATKLGVAEMADAAVKDYKEAIALAETPTEKTAFELKSAQTLYEAGKMEEAVAPIRPCFRPTLIISTLSTGSAWRTRIRANSRNRPTRCKNSSTWRLTPTHALPKRRR